MSNCREVAWHLTQQSMDSYGLKDLLVLYLCLKHVERFRSLASQGGGGGEKKKKKSNLCWLGLPKMVNLETITENQQLSLLVPQHLGCGGKSFMKDTIVFVWSGWMENTCSWIWMQPHWVRLGDMFGLQRVVYIVFATSPKIPFLLVKLAVPTLIILC